MPFIQLENDVELYYEDSGSGIPVIFIHGVWMSSRFFQKQKDYFSKEFRFISLDLRGHGQSSHIHRGHTISSYAKDLHAFIEILELKNVVLAGWSMGAFVIWEYIQQFREENMIGTVIIDELASDFKWPDFPIGAFTFETLIQFMQGIQNNRENFVKSFIPLMFKKELAEEELKWMVDEVTKLPESIASAILFDQSIVDYRPMLSSIQKPVLLCFGREEKLIPVAAGEHLHEHIPNSELVIFEESCHCPFLEEPDLFNATVSEFIKKLI
jgi:non-heme chloroperoxidase